MLMRNQPRRDLGYRFPRGVLEYPQQIESLGSFYDSEFVSGILLARRPIYLDSKVSRNIKSQHL